MIRQILTKIRNKIHNYTPEIVKKSKWSLSWFFNDEICSRPTSVGNHINNSGVNVEIGRSINGSGPTCFGGNKEWPCVKMRFALPSGRRDLAAKLAGELRPFIDKFIDENRLMKL